MQMRIGLRDSRSLVSKQINWIDSFSNALQIGRTSLFILILGVTVRWISIHGSDETVHRELFHLNRDREILMERPDEPTWISVIKRIRSLPSDHNPTIRMHPPRVNLSCYNSHF